MPFEYIYQKGLAQDGHYNHDCTIQGSSNSSYGLRRNDLPALCFLMYTDNLFIEKVSHYWLTLVVICMAMYMPNFGLVR